MKKLKLIILLLVLQTSIKAQSYFPFPNTTAIWTSYHNGWGNGNIVKFGMFGDTIINSSIYKKIYQNFDYNFNISNSFYQGAIREVNKKVFIIKNGWNTEAPLYDFSLNVGDTAKSLTNSNYIMSLAVDSIDTIVINGQNHKRWKFKTVGFSIDEYWIEGIGSTNGLLYPFFTGSDNCFNLLCVSRDSSVIYQYSDMPNTPACGGTIPYDCEGALNPAGINEASLERKIVLFPNPFSNSAILKTSIKLEDATLKVFDIIGQEVLNNSHLSGQEIKINRGILSSGNYYYKLTQKDVLISTGKLIIE